MVVVQRYPSNPRFLGGNYKHRSRVIGSIFVLSLILFLTRRITTTTTTISNDLTEDGKQRSAAADAKLRRERVSRTIPRPQEVLIMPPKDKDIPVSMSMCPYGAISDLTEEELHPKAGMRHMVTPPQGGTLTLVCCQTTKGPLNIAAHSKWAPHGAQRFLDMVRSGYFNEGVPLMRCIPDFLCQFGLAGAKSKIFRGYIEDDPNWLPEGPTHRQNDIGVNRFARGYLAYAGNNPNSRSNQLIMSLRSSGPLGGGSPWEIPWGEVVGSHSFDTISQFYSGYGEGPLQSLLWENEGYKKVKKDFPLLDYIESCHVVDQRFED